MDSVSTENYFDRQITAFFIEYWNSCFTASERQSAWMSKITTDDLTRSGTGYFIAVPIWQQRVNQWRHITCVTEDHQPLRLSLSVPPRSRHGDLSQWHSWRSVPVRTSAALWTEGSGTSSEPTHQL